MPPLKWWSRKSGPCACYWEEPSCIVFFFFLFFFSLVGLICGGRPVHWHAADSVGCGQHVAHQVLRLWESKYLATYLIGSSARISEKLNRAEFNLFCKCLLFSPDLYSQPSFTKFSNCTCSELLHGYHLVWFWYL